MLCSCGASPLYRCSVCGRLLCAEHSRLAVVCSGCLPKASRLDVSVEEASSLDMRQVVELAERMWGEPSQLAYGREYCIRELPALVAKSGRSLAGFASYTRVEEGVLLVALGVHPAYQRAGVGRRLIEALEAEAKREGGRLLVSTSNDNLPALAFYQKLGFHLREVKPEAILRKHGMLVSGVGGIPVRDEVRLLKPV